MKTLKIDKVSSFLSKEHPFHKINPAIYFYEKEKTILNASVQLNNIFFPKLIIYCQTAKLLLLPSSQLAFKLKALRYIKVKLKRNSKNSKKMYVGTYIIYERIDKLKRKLYGYSLKLSENFININTYILILYFVKYNYLNHTKDSFFYNISK